MNFRKMTLLAASVAALAPVASNATPEKSALQACAQAFVSSLAANGASAPSYKVAYSGEFPGSMVEFYNREFTFELHAHDQKTGSQVAHATCSTDMRGNVVALSPMPLEVVRPSLALRN